MALILNDGKLLLEGSALAAHLDCCCEAPLDYCNFGCATTLHVTGGGGGNFTCETGLAYQVVGEMHFSNDNLDGTYSTTDITSGPPNYASVGGTFHLGTYGSSTDRGIRIQTIQAYWYLTRIPLWFDEIYAYRMQTTLSCSVDEFGVTALCCGPINIATQMYRDGVWFDGSLSAGLPIFSSYPPYPPQTRCTTHPGLTDACGETADVSPGDWDWYCEHPGMPSTNEFLWNDATASVWAT